MLAELVEHVQMYLDLNEWLQDLGDLIEAEVEKGDITMADYVLLGFELVSIFDPNGVAGFVASYTHDTCDKLY